MKERGIDRRTEWERERKRDIKIEVQRGRETNSKRVREGERGRGARWIKDIKNISV